MWRRDVSERGEQEVTLADLIDEIADQLKPWQEGLERRRVLDEIRSTIDQLGATNFAAGSRTENKQYAEQVLATLETLVKQLKLAPKGFYWSLAFRSSQLGLWRPEQTRGGLLFELLNAEPRIEQASGLFDELLNQVSKLSEQCRAVILNPIGDDPRANHPLQYWAAYVAFLLMKRLSIEEPKITSHGNTTFCNVASLLFEAASGERDCNLIVACRRISQHFKAASTQAAIEQRS